MKRITFTLCLSAAFISSVAVAQQNHFFYVSANAGIFQGSFNNRFLDQTDVIQQNIVQPADQHGYTGGIAVGFRQLISQTYFLGAELSQQIDGQYASFQSGAATAAFSDQAQIKSHADLEIIPGMMLSDAVAAYLKLGLSHAIIHDSLSTPSGYTPTIVNVNNNQNALGFAAGLGIEKSITKNIALFTEANYNDYGTVNFSNFQNFSTTYTHSSHIYSYDVVVGASYQFK